MTAPEAPATYSNRGNAAAALAFAVLFPAFISYQVLVKAGALPPALGGFGTTAAVLALPLALYAFFQQARHHGFAPTPIGLLFALYLLLFSTVVLIESGRFADPVVTQPHIAFIFKFVVWYFVARTVDAESRRFQRAARWLILIVMGLIFWMAIDAQSLAAVLLPEPGGFQADYQAAAMVFVAMAAYVIPSLRLGGRIAFYALGVFALFLVGARSEFIAFFVLAVVVEWCKAPSRTVITLAMVGAVLTGFALLKGVEASEDGNRILGLLEIASDESAIMRSEMLADAWITVGEHPVLGDYASYPPGAYAHNLVSAWVDFGIVGFFLLVCLLAFPLAGLALRFGSDSRRDDYIRALAVALMVALLMAAAKMHAYQLLAISLGLYARYRATRRARLLAAAA